MRTKVKRIFERTTKDYLTLSDIKKQLKITNKKDDSYQEKCRQLTSALKALVAEKYLISDNNNRFYKHTNSQKLSLESCIFEMLSKKGYVKASDLATMHQEFDVNTINTTLRKLELEGKLYNDNLQYIAFPSNFSYNSCALFTVFTIISIFFCFDNSFIFFKSNSFSSIN